MEMLLVPIAIMAALIVMMIIERLAAGRRHRLDREWDRRALANERTRNINAEQIVLNMHREVELMRDDLLVLKRLNRAAIVELRKVKK